MEEDLPAIVVLELVYLIGHSNNHSDLTYTRFLRKMRGLQALAMQRCLETEHPGQ